MAVTTRLAHAWNALMNKDRENLERTPTFDYGIAYGGRPDRVRFTTTNEKSIVSSIYTRLAIDVSGVPIKHVKLDEDDRYLEDVQSQLNYCLTQEANIDQAARALRQDIAMTLFDKGVAAIVPTDTTVRPTSVGAYDVVKLRVGDVVQWMPQHVKVSLYNELSGKREEVTFEKKFVAIVENPFYAVMNEPNSTLQRLIRKLNLLDAVDEQSGSGKLDLIIQLPYTIKTEARREMAEKRRADIEFQLKDSKYGIAYADATEKITQLNRPAENNLLGQIKFLTELLFSQLGITQEVMNGTADEATMLNYYNRTIEPIVTAIVEAMRRTFLSKTARTQKHSIVYFWDPFKLVPIGQLAEIGDKFTRNEIMTSNEFRQVVGRKPVRDDPKADQLRNSNMPQSELGAPPLSVPSERVEPEEPISVLPQLTE